MGQNDLTQPLHGHDVLRWTIGTDDATAGTGTALHVIKVGARGTNDPRAVNGGDTVILWADVQGYLHPHLDAFLLDSDTTVATGATGTAKTGLGAFRDIDAVITVTAASGTSPTMDIILEGRLDGTNFAALSKSRFTTAGTGIVHVTKRLATGSADGTGDPNAGVVRGYGFGDALRVRREITGTSPSFSYTVYINGVS